MFNYVEGQNPFSAPPSIKEGIDNLVKKWSGLHAELREATAKGKMIEDENAKLRELNVTISRTLSEMSVIVNNKDAIIKQYESAHAHLRESLNKEVKNHSASVSRTLDVVCKNVTLRERCEAMEREHKEHLERIERDTARILQLRTEKDHYASAAQSLATEIDQQKGVIRRLQERLGKTFTAAMEDTRIEEFRAACKTLRERGDRWKARATQLLTERANLRTKLDRCENNMKFVADQRDDARNALVHEQEEYVKLKADLTKALDSRTVQRPMKFPGC